MKQFKFLATTIAVAGILLFSSSCNSGKEENKNDAIVKTDTAAIKPANILFFKHRVANFNKWLAVYDSHDSVRLAYGLHNYGLSRGVDDPNMVFVSLKMEDIGKAKAFAGLPELKTAMQKGGVEGEPVIMYYDRQMFDPSTTHDLTRVMIIHKVKDYDAWKKVFESNKTARIDAGLKDRSFGYEVGDNKTVYVIATVSDLKKAKDFFASKDLKDKMQIAGVESEPAVFFYNLVKKY